MKICLPILSLALSGTSFGTACSVDSAQSQTENAVSARYGVDYSWARPAPASLRAQGYTFVARYLSHDAGKNLSHAEAASLIDAGLDVVANWEDGATNALSGYGQGRADALEAEAQAAADGAPASRPIYFSVDFDATAGEQPVIGAYFDGVASVVGRARTGAYGGYWVIKRLFDAGKISWGWQTYAWSYGNWDPRAQVRQIQNGIDGGSLDEDQAVAADFGQWGHGSSGTREYAFQANTTSLWTTGTEGTTDWHLGMMPGTSPSIAALADGGFEVAFQANTGSLWTVGSAGNTDWHLGMMAGTSPSIAALAGGGFEVAFEANTTSLWTVGAAGDKDWGLGMYSGTSPSIAALPGGGFEVAFEANTTSLWTVGTAGDKDWHLGMYTGTNPSIAALPGGGFEVAFEANTTSLWTVGTAGDRDWGLGMYPGTSPSVSALSTGGFEVTFEANTASLWQAGDAGTGALNLGMYAGTSPSGT